jgi:hypothetical protein
MLKLSAGLSIKVCILWATFVMSLLTVGALTNPSLETSAARAMVEMIWGLFLIWIVLGGSFMLKLRDPVRSLISRISLGPRLKFFLFATVLALVEEAVTTGMTNLAPVFGVPIGQAYITASANYLDVIAFHSVVVFLPMFIVWAWLLGRYDFEPKMVLLLYGLSGTLAESFSFGLQNLLLGGLWVLVYGLMVYLPAYSFDPRAARKPKPIQHLLGVLAPIVAAIPVAILILLLFHRPPIEFQ